MLRKVMSRTHRRVGFILTAYLALRPELLIDKREAGELVLIDAADDVVGNRCQHRLFSCKFRVEIDGVACASLKCDKIR